MKTFEITKEQILQLNSYDNYNIGVALKQWFPEAFKRELEYGKWLKTDEFDNHKWMIFQIDENSYYGFDANGKWIDIKSKGYDGTKDANNRYATDKEVETALIVEAKRRGFNKTTMITQTFNENQKMCIGFWDERSVKFERNKLFAKGVRIFDNGKWAEIISEPIEVTLEQIAEKFNVNVEQLKIKK